ncbi:TetR/AcrR family transcriptional regulator [Tenacibaculum agarivorans]|uniref:TetR/AcrR family transcriptional regulator n=1 Tax=Tenacibaculum agarivorans TaxID=1908389 RepID=UPI00094B9806|nr:TetR/AcrR family transcriptional regulator [Tenacibaculum agarivorans]
MLKSERTKLHIIETVAPIFNRTGYSAMSLSKITQAAGLTKGAIYGHFENKEELAIEAFRYSVRTVLRDLNAFVDQGETPLDMLINITRFYKNYYNYSKKFGGCPILNTGVDAENQKHSISNLVRSYNKRILNQFIKLIDKGKQEQQIKETIDSEVYAKRFFYMIEGAVYMSHIMKDESYLLDMSHIMKHIILNELRQK